MRLSTLNRAARRLKLWADPSSGVPQSAERSPRCREGVFASSCSVPLSHHDSPQRYHGMTELTWLWLDRITIVTAALAAILSGLTWIKSRRLITLNRLAEENRRAPITIRLVNGNRTFELPYRPRRDQLSRQELVGLLGLYYGEPRFDPVVVQGVLESGSLSRVLAGNAAGGDADDVLTVEVKETHTAFFDKIVSRSKAADTEKRSSGRHVKPNPEVSPGQPDGVTGRIWNLTPHAMHYDDGQVVRTIESDGMLRLDQEEEPTGSVHGMRLVRTRYGKPGGLPDGVAAGDVLIVSTLVGDSWDTEDRPAGVTVIVPDTGATCKRDSAGRIVSVSRFISK